MVYDCSLWTKIACRTGIIGIVVYMTLTRLLHRCTLAYSLMRPQLHEPAVILGRTHVPVPELHRNYSPSVALRSDFDKKIFSLRLFGFSFSQTTNSFVESSDWFGAESVLYVSKSEVRTSLGLVMLWIGVFTQGFSYSRGSSDYLLLLVPLYLWPLNHCIAMHWYQVIDPT